MLLVFIVFFCPPVFSLSKPHVCFRTCAQADNVWACVFICVPARTCNYRSGHIFAPCACQHICGPSCQAIGIRFGVCVKVSLVLCGKTFKYSFQGSQAASCFCLYAAQTKSLTQESLSRLHLFKNVHFFFARLFNLSSNNTNKEQVLEAENCAHGCAVTQRPHVPSWDQFCSKLDKFSIDCRLSQSRM